jgi:Zn ribbon nucleic-acid-binding protein
MAEGKVHKHLKQVALRWLKFKVTDLVGAEVKFHNAYSVADAAGVNLKRKEVRIIEVKSSKADLKRDDKLFKKPTSYYYHAHYSYIMCPEGVLDKNDIPKYFGLLYVDDYDNVEVIKNPTKNKGRLKTYFKTTLRRTARALTNDKIFSKENIESYDRTNGHYKRKAKLWLIRTRCPDCKKHPKILIHEDNTNIVECPKCGTEIDLDKAKVNKVSGYNKKFIKQANNLIDGDN